MISQALHEAHSQKDVVALINQGGNGHFNGDALAGQHAFVMAQELDFDCSDENIRVHLEILAKAGATFSFAAAMAAAQQEFVSVIS